MDSKYDKFFEKAIERDNAGALVEVVGCLQEAIQTVIADGGKPNNSISCIALFYRIHRMMGSPDENRMEEAYQACGVLVRGGP